MEEVKTCPLEWLQAPLCVLPLPHFCGCLSFLPGLGLSTDAYHSSCNP